MIDGVKIDVPGAIADYWLTCPLLDFHTSTSVTTGKMDKSLSAKYNGLTFVITQSKIYADLVYCSVRGSLHKYYNAGKTNANDFNIDQLRSVIYDLSEKFHIHPETAILRNVEFGVNVFTSTTAKAIIKNLVAHNDRAFLDFSINRVKIGKGFSKQRYALKIYDKGKQSGANIKNLVRFEIAVNKMDFLKQYEIRTLADLANISKIKPLGRILIDHWETAIYYDKKVNWKDLTDFERKKLLYYATPRNWEDFTPKQRLRAKAHFQKLMSKYGTSNDHEKTAGLIAKKWNELTAEKCPRLNRNKPMKRSREMSTFEPLEYRNQTYPNNKTDKYKKKAQKKAIKNTPKPTPFLTQKMMSISPGFCINCKNDISHKKAGTLFCSKRCNNSHHAKQRKQKRIQRKKSETLVLHQMLLEISTPDILLLVAYSIQGTPETVSLYQSEIYTSWKIARTVTSVTIPDTGKRITGNRAKTFINQLSKFNFKNRNNENSTIKKSGTQRNSRKSF